MKNHSLKTKLSLTIATVVLLTVGLISLFANLLIQWQFKSYIAKEQSENVQNIVTTLSQQYDAQKRLWNLDILHAVGMYALYDGFIIKVQDTQSNVIWDAEGCDMDSCRTVMNEITNRMHSRYPQGSGKFTSEDMELTQFGKVVGRVSISYYGPYFLSENDFFFLDSMNMILGAIGIAALIISVVTGWIMSKRMSTPILKTVDAARQMAYGDYAMRIEYKTDIVEISDLMHSINHLAESLSKQEALRKRLTADVAHELRTPLTTTGTMMEAMLEGVWEPTPARLQSCYDEIDRIGKIVMDLENLAKIDSDNLKLEKKPVNLIALVKKVSGNFEASLNQKELFLDVVGDACDIWADANRMSQVIVNILSNAIKYSNNGGEIHITVTEEEKAVRLCVEDNGIGISESELPFLFERFYRADKSRNRATGGSGIGLTVVKSIVVAHGGHVYVKSVLGQGSCFEVVLPKEKKCIDGEKEFKQKVNT